MIVRFVLCVLLALTACGTLEGNGAAGAAGPSTGATGAEMEGPGSRFDGLSITMQLSGESLRSGGELESFLEVRNNSGKAVTDPACLIGSGRYALVPADDPDAELWMQPVVDCQGAFTMPAGFVDRYAGPPFIGRTKEGNALPPGDYIATLEIEGYSERLTEPVEVTE